MFDYLSGSIRTLGLNKCVVDTHGIGWSLTVSAKTAARLSSGKEGKVFTYLNMGSSDRAVMELFGFATEEERNFFEMLISVSGIGPKAAIAILSALDPQELTMCVLAGDAKALTCAQGIGMKGAQKIILELKDKVSKTSGTSAATSASSASASSDLSEATNALVVLGYPPQVAASAVRRVADQANGLQDLIRLALKSMGEK